MTEDAGADAQADAAADGGGMMCEADTDIRTGAACPDVASGVYAMKSVIDVWWQDDIDPPFIDPGRGLITVVQKATLSDVCDDGSIGHAELQHCGLTLPPLSSWVVCHAYQLEAPDELWDRPSMPRFVTTGMVTELGVGGMLSLVRSTELIGITLPASDGLWPRYIGEVSCDFGGTAEDCFPDHDGDEAPGVRFVFGKTGMNYRDTGCGLEADQPVIYQGPPSNGLEICHLGNPSCQRASQLHIGMRTTLSASAGIVTCGEGMASLVGSSSTDSIAVRAAGCVMNDGTACNPSATEFLDSMLPEYKVLEAGNRPPMSHIASPCECPGGCMGDACPLDQTRSVGTRTAMVRIGDVGDAIDCAAVRTAVESAYPGTSF